VKIEIKHRQNQNCRMGSDGRHLCEYCFEDWYEECDSELKEGELE